VNVFRLLVAKRWAVPAVMLAALWLAVLIGWLIRPSPEDVSAVVSSAQESLAGSDPASAEPQLTRWIELRPVDPEPLRLRMDLRHRIARGKWNVADRLRVMEDALADGNRVLALRPGLIEVRREVAWMALQVGRFAEAEAHCRAGLAANRTDGWISYLLAKALHPQGKRDEAVAALDPVIRSQPKFAEALLLRGVLYREADQPAKAIPLLRQALELNTAPRRECLYQLGLALEAAGQTDEAKRVLAEVDLHSLKGQIEKDRFPHNPAMRVQVAEALIAAGKPADAEKELDAALAEDPTLATALRLKADLRRIAR
jgi:tetratricopeptide (TPR) repeat protein